MKNRIIALVVGMLLLLVAIILFQSCTKRWEEEEVKYTAPNWTSDGKIVFVEEKIIYLYEKQWLLDVDRRIKSKELWLCEVENDGTGKQRIANISSNEHLWAIRIASSALDYVVIGEEQYKEIWVIKRDGTGLQKVGDGTNPNFSPDAEKIVYQKQDNGIWLMNRDGSGDHQIIASEDIEQPNWSHMIEKISMIQRTSANYGYMVIADTSGLIEQTYTVIEISYPFWSKADSSIVFAIDPHFNGISLNIATAAIETLSIESGQGLNPNPGDEQFIGYDGEWFVIQEDGTNKWYLTP
jgi:hypothetical protein